MGGELPSILIAWDDRVGLHPPGEHDLQQRISGQACGIAKALLGTVDRLEPDVGTLGTADRVASTSPTQVQLLIDQEYEAHRKW